MPWGQGCRGHGLTSPLGKAFGLSTLVTKAHSFGKTQQCSLDTSAASAQFSQSVRPRDSNLLIPAHKEVKRGCKHMETGTPSVRMLLLQGAEKTNQKRHGRKFYRTRSLEEGQHQVDQFINSVTSTQVLSVFQLGSSVCELCPQASSPHGFNIAANVPGIAHRHHGRREKAPLLTRLFSQWETSPGSSSPSSFPLAPY